LRERCISRGELQTSALRNIGEFLEAIRLLLEDAEPRYGQAAHLISGADREIPDTYQGAQAFMCDLQSTIQLLGLSVEQSLGWSKISRSR